MQINSFEWSTNLNKDDIYLINYYQDIIDEVENACPSHQIIRGSKYTTSIIASLKKKYTWMNKAQVLKETKALHDRLAASHAKLEVLPDEYYCIIKYTIYYAQNWLRNTHLKILEEEWILWDFEWYVTSWDIWWYDVKLQTMQAQIDELKWYEDAVWMGLQIKMWQRLEWLTDQWKNVESMSLEIMRLSIYKSMYDLIEAWAFTREDLTRLKNKFIVNTHLSCWSFHGNYQIKQKMDNNGNHVSYETTALPLAVNVCWNYFLINELAHQYRKIIIHELAHHYYYYHDSASKTAFQKICWNSKYVQNGKCGDVDFVNTYSATNSEEDYAEHFMFRFLDLQDPATSKMKEKFDYFENKVSWK